MRTTRLKDAIARPAKSGGQRRAPISSSAQTPNSARCRRSTQARTRTRKFVQDFVGAWNKVMNLDRFDLAASRTAAAA